MMTTTTVTATTTATRCARDARARRGGTTTATRARARATTARGAARRRRRRRRRGRQRPVHGVHAEDEKDARRDGARHGGARTRRREHHESIGRDVHVGGGTELVSAGGCDLDAGVRRGDAGRHLAGGSGEQSVRAVGREAADFAAQHRERGVGGFFDVAGEDSGGIGGDRNQAAGAGARRRA